MQAFNRLFTHFGIGFAVPLIAIALAIGALAGMISWLDGPSEGLLLIGRRHGYLPPYFQKVNRYGIEVRIIAAQGVVITLIAVLYAFIPSVSHAYWIFTALATQVYLIMYVLMFIAAIKLRRSQPDHPRGYRAPMLGLLCVLGAVSAVAALVIGFVPPSQFGHLNLLSYALLILAGDSHHRDPPAAADGPAPQAGVAGGGRTVNRECGALPTAGAAPPHTSSFPLCDTHSPRHGRCSYR
jgi:glutamate:GABA antiporter